MNRVIEFQGQKIMVNQLYIGREGCRCGCGGRFTESMATIKKHLKEHADAFESADVNDGFGDERYVEINLDDYANGDAKVAAFYFKYV